MSWETSYGAAFPTTPAVGYEYSTIPPPPLDPTPTETPSGDSYYQSYAFTPPESPAETTRACINIPISRIPTQGALIGLSIALGVVFMFLVIAMFVIGVFVCLRRVDESIRDNAPAYRPEVILDREPDSFPAAGYQEMGRARRRYERTRRSRYGTGSTSDYSRRHRHRRSMPVTRTENEGLHRAGWEEPGAHPAVYTQYANAGAPLYFPAGQAQQRGGRDKESTVGVSDRSSTVQDEREAANRRASVRRHDSRTSSSARGRVGRS